MRLDAKDIRQFLEDDRLVNTVVDRIVAARQVPARFTEHLADCFRHEIGDDLTRQLLFELLQDPRLRERLINIDVERGAASRDRTLRPAEVPSKLTLDAAQQVAVRATIAVLDDAIRNPLTTILVAIQARRECGLRSKDEQVLLERIEAQTRNVERALRRLSAAPHEILIQASDLDLPIA